MAEPTDPTIPQSSETSPEDPGPEGHQPEAPQPEDLKPAGPPPGGAGLVLVVGPPRCGTTLAFDALRCHPHARLERSSAMFSRLIRGSHSRYPRELCVQSGGIRFEQKKGDVVRAPSFNWTEEENIGGWMVERLHPHFFLNDVDWFITRIEQLDAAGAQVRLVLRVRDPRAMLRSQWLYKRRVPAWQSWLTEESMVGFARESYEAMGRLRELRPAAALSVYQDSKAEAPAMIGSLYDEVWPGEDWSELAEEVADRVSIKSRGARAANRFAATIDEQDTDEFDVMLKAGSTDLRACVKAYNKLIKR
ncbi:MAG: hypothetical protein ACI89L_000595 [Phycisphaerales bacterium]|jgi:hypothetical protein